jgi:disulfide bond formation protein DsbB
VSIRLSRRQGFFGGSRLRRRNGFCPLFAICIASGALPLCIFQRVGVISVGIIALLAALHNPGRTVIRYGVYWVCWRRWLVVRCLCASCGCKACRRYGSCLRPGLDYLMETSPMWDVLSKVFKGSGECAKVDWTFLGQAMPFWVAVFFVGVIVLQLWLAFRNPESAN